MMTTRQANTLMAVSFLCVLGVAVTTSAQSFSRNGKTDGPSERVIQDLLPPGPATITQSTNTTTITAGNSVSCNTGSPGFFHTDNSYFRAFTLSAFNPPLDSVQFMVQQINFGIESANANGTGTTQPVTVSVFDSSANPPTNATIGAALSSVTVNVPDQTLTVLAVPLVTQPVLINASDILAVEIFTPNGTAPVNNSFFVGSNALGQSGPTFIRSAPCTITEITPTSGIGFPNMHLVMTVSGNNQVPIELQSFDIR